MPPDGLLYLGGAETVLGITARFAPMPNERGVYGVVRRPNAPAMRHRVRQTPPCSIRARCRSAGRADPETSGSGRAVSDAPTRGRAIRQTVFRNSVSLVIAVGLSVLSSAASSAARRSIAAS